MLRGYRVMLNGKEIDKVFYSEKADGGHKITAEDVRQSLINHDGYDPGIVVVRERKAY